MMTKTMAHTGVLSPMASTTFPLTTPLLALEPVQQSPTTLDAPISMMILLEQEGFISVLLLLLAAPVLDLDQGHRRLETLSFALSL